MTLYRRLPALRNDYVRYFMLLPLLCLFAVTLLVSPVQAQGEWEFPLPTVTARGAVLIDADSGQVLFGKAEHDTFFPASTTKIMTALLAIEHGDPSELTTVTTTAVDVEGSLAYLRPGERMSLQDMLHGLMLSSGNDAAIAIAEMISGSEEAFAALMNERAAELGLTDTHFVNPHGLHDPEHYTTPVDLARLSRAALANPDFAKLVATQEYTTTAEPAREYYNGNRLLWTLPGATGIKTGYTPEANSTLVASAARDGRHLIAVVMDTGSEAKWTDAVTLLEYGFDAFVTWPVLSSDEPAAQVTVAGGAAATVPALPAEAVTVLIGREGTEPGPYVLGPADVSITPDVIESLAAPVTAGAEVGSARVSGAGQELAVSALIAAVDVPLPEQTASTWRRQWDAVASWPVWELIRLWWYVPVLVIGLWRFVAAARSRRHRRRQQMLRQQAGTLPMHRLFRGQ